MDLRIKCDNAKISVDLMNALQRIDAKNIDNIDDIATAIVEECDPAYLVTTGNRDGLLESIGIEYVKEYFGLVDADA